MHLLTPVDLRTGQTVWVRPIEADDAAELQRAFALLSDLSRYQRFLTGTPALSDVRAKLFSDIDHVDHQALVALSAEHSRDIVAVARYIRFKDAHSDADVAITVADDWHGRGLATVLLAMLSEQARAAGIRRFCVDMLADNAAVRALVRAAGGEGETVDGEVVNAHIVLSPVVVPLSADALLRIASTQTVAAVPQPLASVVPELRPVAHAVVSLDT